MSETPQQKNTRRRARAALVEPIRHALALGVSVASIKMLADELAAGRNPYKPYEGAKP